MATFVTRTCHIIALHVHCIYFWWLCCTSQVCSKIPVTCLWQYIHVYPLWSFSGSLYILKNFQVFVYIVDLRVCSFSWETNGSVERKERRFERSRILHHFNHLKTKRRLLYLKTQFLPRSKHVSSSSYIRHGVGPLVDPFRSHVSRSLFIGLP